jgi:hypothetical protein
MQKCGCSFGPAGCLTLPPTVHHHIQTPAGNTNRPRYQAHWRFFEPDGAVWPLRPKAGSAQRTAFELAGFARNCSGRPGGQRHAQRLHRAQQALRFAAGADRRLSPSGPACTAASPQQGYRRARLGFGPTAGARWVPWARSLVKPSTRVSTLSRCPESPPARIKQKDAIAAAVERPMPGRVCSCCAAEKRHVQCHHIWRMMQIERTAVISGPPKALMTSSASAAARSATAGNQVKSGRSSPTRC